MKNSTILRAVFAILAGILLVPLCGKLSFFMVVFISVLWLLISFSIILFSIKYKQIEKLIPVLSILGSFFLGCVLASIPNNKVILPLNSNVSVEGEIINPPVWRESKFGFNTNIEYTCSFLFKIFTVTSRERKIFNLKEKANCIIISENKFKIHRGDKLKLSGKFREYKHASNPGQFDVARYFELKKIHYKLISKKNNLKLIKPENKSLYLKVRLLFDKLRENFELALSTDGKYKTEASIIKRMLLGSRNSLTTELAELLRETNTFHIIAISGLHIGILCAIWWAGMWLFGIPWKYRGLTLLPVLWGYATMVGFRASVIRACLMFSALSLAPVINRVHTAVQGLVIAGFLYILFCPLEVYSFGTQLTFLAVVAILSFSYIYNASIKRFKIFHGPFSYDIEHSYQRYIYVFLRYFSQIIGATIAIWLITWPITLMRGNLITPLSWLANLLIVPALGIIISLGIGTLLTYNILPLFSEIIHKINLIFLHIILKIIDLISKLPFAFFSMRTLNPLELFLYYFSLTALFFYLISIFKKNKYSKIFCFITCFSFILFFVLVYNDGQNKNNLNVVTLDVGLGDSAVLHLPNGETVLIDGGVRYGEWSMGTRVVIPYLRAAGIDKLSAVICSHFDRDHVGGLIEILKYMNVKVVYAPPELTTNKIAQQLKKIAQNRNIRWQNLFAGDMLCFNSVTACVINPPAIITNKPLRAAKWGSNPWSIVTRWEWNGRSFLTTGDSTIVSEAIEIANKYKLKSDILKAGHHGSKSSTSQKFLDKVNPAVAIISVGPNRLGLPVPKIIKRLENKCKLTVNTEKSGAIMITIHPKKIDIKKLVPKSGN